MRTVAEQLANRDRETRMVKDGSGEPSYMHERLFRETALPSRPSISLWRRRRRHLPRGRLFLAGQLTRQREVGRARNILRRMLQVVAGRQRHAGFGDPRLATRA